ncbi:sulfatase-like hydrolase/transferase [Roseiarcaceae bacterium H3SJ34-1]|uniref:sulfatase family protein n=1 Tax=Terripilifer ovatus TaxID=3032367 RepID=UPI003AB97E17|nr:sulfatase-like hydrolase/transferase [Roseiarcaceae bacterium H3SJ34-1]
MIKGSISRRDVLKTGAAGSLALAVEGGRASAQDNRPPNIVYIMADDMGYADLSCYGRTEYQTPNIDRLATGGMRILQAYANSAVCSATRTALITGRYQYRLPIGLEEPLSSLGDRHIGLPSYHPTLPSLLRKAGYGTTLIGKWHLGKLPDFGPLQSGYDHFYGFRSGAVDYFTHKSGGPQTDTHDLWDNDAQVHEAGYLTSLLGKRAVSVIETYAKAQRPFFVSLHFNAPHWPWEGPGDEAESQRIRALAQYDAGSQKTYADMVVALDAEVGRVLAALDANGIADNTLVVFTSDNGGERFAKTWPFSGRKTELLEGGLRIPAVVRWPRGIPAGKTSEQTIISMDWMPTFLELAKTAPDPQYPMDGLSLVRTLEGTAPVTPRKFFWRYKNLEQQAMRDGDWKYLKIKNQTFLFNVVDDPMERANYKARNPALFERMVAEYAAWNATMLPIDPKANSGGPNAAQMADHFGVEPGKPR